MALAAIHRLATEETLLLSTTSDPDSRYRTPLSDTDMLAICEPGAESAVRAAVASAKRLDLEIRRVSWFDEMERRLRDHSVSVSGRPSPFSFLDLRFLARIDAAMPVIERGAIRRRLAALREPLRLAASEQISTRFVSCFEDAAGFILSGNPSAVRLLAGEITQNACLLALLQSELVDLAPKWAPARCLATVGQGDRRPAARAMEHLARGSDDEHAWAVEMLHLANEIVANGICTANRWTLPEPESPAASRRTALPWCLMGTAGHLACADVEQNRILLASPQAVAAVAGGDALCACPVIRLRTIRGPGATP